MEGKSVTPPHAPGGVVYRPAYERRQPGLVERPVGADARAHVEPERADSSDRLGHVPRPEAAGEEHRDRQPLADRPAEAPVVDAARPAERLHRPARVAGVEEHGVDVRRDRLGLVRRLRPGHVDDLDERPPRQRLTEPGIRAVLDPVDDLDRRDAGGVGLPGNLVWVLAARQQPRGDGGRHGPGDLGDPGGGDHARPARHRPDEPDRVGAEADRGLSLLYGPDAADLEARAGRRVHRAVSRAAPAGRGRAAAPTSRRMGGRGRSPPRPHRQAGAPRRPTGRPSPPGYGRR